MFSGLVSIIGLTPTFLIGLMLASLTTPSALVLRRSRPIIGAGLLGLGLVGQVLFGAVVAASVVSDTARTFFVGVIE